MIRVLYVCPSTGIGGAETFIKSTFHGHDPKVVRPHYLLFSQGPLFDYLKAHGANVETLEKRPRLSRPLSVLAAQKEIRQCIDKNEIQLVHSTMAYGALFSFLTPRKCRHVWFQHGPASGWQDTLAGILPHQGLITNSRYTSETQSRLERPVSFLVPQRRTMILNLGVSSSVPVESETTALRNSLITEHGLSQTTMIVAMMTRIQDWKGIHIFVDALRGLQEKYSRSQIFGIVWGEPFSGSDEYYKQLLEQAQGVRIHFAGHAANARLAMSACDAVVNASIQPEPFGFSLIEAMSVGAVPIAANWGGPSEIITDHHDGLLFKPQSALDLAIKIESLLTTPELLNRLKTNAVDTYKKKYSLQQMMQNLEAFYQSLLSSKPSKN